MHETCVLQLTEEAMDEHCRRCKRLNRTDMPDWAWKPGDEELKSAEWMDAEDASSGWVHNRLFELVKDGLVRPTSGGGDGLVI